MAEGLELRKVERELDHHVRLIENAEQVMRFLKERGILTVLITAGPIQVADILATGLDFDSVYGSEYEIEDGRFTGRIRSHLDNEGKLNCLRSFCTTNSIRIARCVAIGDNESDIAVFENCGRSIAINYSAAVKGTASEYLFTEDLADILAVLEGWLAE